MPDQPPLLFKKSLSSLRPANAAAEEALTAYGQDDTLRVRITRSQGNVRRNALYWSCLNVAAPMLAEKAPGLTVEMLHRILKRKLGKARPITLPSGDMEWDYESMSFAKMPEHERSEYINSALDLLASWLGCRVEELLDEAA